MFKNTVVRTAAHVFEGTHLEEVVRPTAHRHKITILDRISCATHSMKQKRTRRAGAKYHARKLLRQYQFAPANEAHPELLGVDSYDDNEYDLLFRAHNPSACEFERREGYNSHAPWPFRLIPLTLETPGAVHWIKENDPRYAVYSCRGVPEQRAV